MSESFNYNADNVLEMGLAYDFMYGTWKDMHWGDEFLGKVLIATIPIGSIKDVQGCHICVVGDITFVATHQIHRGLVRFVKNQCVLLHRKSD